MREFRDRSASWRVWLVPPSSALPKHLVQEWPDGWLCFEDVLEGRRWRLAVSQAPPDWNELSDIRLRQLLGMAKKGPVVRVTTKAVSEQRRRAEDDALKGNGP